MIAVLSRVILFQAPGSTAGEDKKDFTFDYSYWSADSTDKHYASQEQVKYAEKRHLLIFLNEYLVRFGQELSLGRTILPTLA